MIWNTIKKIFGTIMLVLGLSMILIVANPNPIELRIFAGILGIVMVPCGLAMLFSRRV